MRSVKSTLKRSPVENVCDRELAQVGLLLEQVDRVDEGFQGTPGGVTHTHRGNRAVSPELFKAHISGYFQGDDREILP